MAYRLIANDMKQGETFVNMRENNSNSNSNSPYARNLNRGFGGNANETYVPGMQENAPGVKNTKHSHAKSNTPVIGFLYSISRKGIGEFWPLHLGTNTIGRSEDNDIVLKECSVSEKHATISIKQMKSTGKLIASIRDVGSKNGMFLNEEELDYDNHTCKTNDLITIGTSYKLLLILIDAEQYGLTVADNFVALDDSEDDFSTMAKGNAHSEDDTRSNFNPYGAENRNVDTGTVDLNGAQFTEAGKTKFM